jgi:membrane protein
MLERVKGLARTTYAIYKYAGQQYGIDRVSRMSAAVAYRAIFAAAPLLIVTIWVVGLAVGGDEARMEILEAIDRIAGPTVVDAVNSLLDSLVTTSTVTGVVGLVLLLWTSSSLFMELQNDLNDIFGVPYDQTTGVLNMVRKRGLSFLWALALGLILIAVLLLNNIWQFLDGLFPESFDPAHRLIGFLTPLMSVVLLPVVFALFFQTLSRIKLRWRAVWWGSFFTSVAFLVASYGASIYFRFSEPSAAGFAGAVFVILLLAYILSAVFLFGAEVTESYDQYLERGRLAPGRAVPETGTAHDPVDAVVADVPPQVSTFAVAGFLVGLLVGRRRK